MAWKRSILTVCFTALAVPALASAQGAPAADYPRDPRSLVLEYAQIYEALGVADEPSRLRLFGDGRVEVHVPRFLPRAGDYELYLAPSEVRSLLARLVEHGVLDFDAGRVRSLRDRARAARLEREGTEVYPVSETRMELEVRLVSYTPPGGVAERNLWRRISWQGHETESRLYPEIAELAGLVAAEGELVELMERPELARMPEEE